MYKDELVNELRVKCIRMLELTFLDVKKAFSAIQTKEIAKINDDEIDKYHMDIESSALRILLRQQIYSKDLRIVTGILKLVDDIERIGDHAEDLMWCVSKLTVEDRAIKFENLEILIESLKNMVDYTLKAYLDDDMNLAKQIIDSDDFIDKQYVKVLEEFENPKFKECQNLVIYNTLIAKYLERIADHLVNIAEWIIYIKNGYYKSKVII